MRIAQIQFSPWDKIYNFDPRDLDVKIGDYVIVEAETGIELGKIVGFNEINQKDRKEPQQEAEELKPLIRKATSIDLDKVPDFKEKNKALKFCHEKICFYNLPMKLVDVRFSLDNSKITFAFIADGRVDFRDLVKELTRHFNKTIRLQQIGIRDEARLCGDYGHCGRELCCRRFLTDLASISSEMAEMQKVAHRGSERISGVCGRLMCCLAFEQEGYEELSKKLPEIGRKIKYNDQKGVVVGHNPLKHTVDIELESENGAKNTILELEPNKLKY